MPQLGESIAEATIIKILAPAGTDVVGDQGVLEVETSKATTTVPAPCRGRLGDWSIETDQSYPVGSVLGYLEVTEEEARRAGLSSPAPEGTFRGEPPWRGSESHGAVPRRHVEPTVRGLPVPAHAAGATYMSPRMKARMHELGLHAADLAGVAGSGAAGRVTVEDFENYLEGLERQRMTPASTMRVAVADAMRRSWTRPLATVGMPLRLDRLLAHRKASDPKAGPALYALRALALALAQDSAPAGRLVGKRIVHPQAIDIGFAVEAHDGVLVPVLRNVDQKPLRELVEPYHHLVEMARQRRLPPEATGGSIATVTNYGTFGLTWATPIPLPEQTLVLGLGAGRSVPHWDGKGFVPATEAQSTLSFDHRVLDGGAAGRLLSRVVELLNAPDQL